ncbi:helix-turn-helix transcriptional regulator [Amycolatopsis nigrescens]|uniref:helix-turn-helix transcriptional regulator n=1 Tax=Amycolatopsis nigrescens TaxID=381445 RepID=UPI0003A8442C|nr:LuxR family transcriptional regulator [Amycolatopsis nigrescens]
MLIVPRLGSGIPLVARAEELRRLRAAFAEAERGEAGAVLLAGDAGVGKTRLLSELGAYAGELGALVLVGRCLDVREGGLPYLPFAEALGPLAGAPDEQIAGAVHGRPALGRLLPQVGFAPAPAAEHAGVTSTEHDPGRRLRTEYDLGQLQLFDAVLGVLTEIAEHRPVVLVVEDLHWADGSTRNLLSFLLSRLRAQRLLIVASYREEDVHRRHPLRALLAELVRLATVRRFELRPFGDAEARRFVEALADGPVTQEFIDSIVERSEGNPFFAEELLASASDCQDLPAGLAEVLLARLEKLSPDTRRALRIASVANGSVSHAVLTEVSGLGELELDEALREAVQHHVLVIEKGCYTFRHALLQEAVYGDLLPGERTRTHAVYAARLLAQPAGRGRDAQLAHHSLESRDLSTALAALLRAAKEAEKLGAPGSALRHIEHALEIWDAVPVAGRPDGVDELKLLGEASYFAGTSGEPERAVAYARSAVQQLDDSVDVDRAAKAWRRLAEALGAQEGPIEGPLAAIGEAWDLVADAEPSAVRAWVLATRAMILRAAGRREDSFWSAQTAVADARAAGTGGAEASALVTLGTLADNAGDVGEARDRLRQAERKARDAGALNVELRAMYFLALSYDEQAELPEAIELYRRGIERAEESGLNWSSFGLEVRARHLGLRYVSGDWPERSAAGSSPGRGVSSAVAARMAAAWVAIVVGRGQFATAEKIVVGLRPQWRTDVQIPISGGAAAIELAHWRGDFAEGVRQAHEAIGRLAEFEPLLLGGLRLGALGIAAASAQAAHARARGDAETAAAAVRDGEALLAHVRDCAEHGRPRGGTMGPEGRAWLARAEAAASGLSGAADAVAWAAAVAAFDYGAVYEQAICRWHYAEAMLAGDQPDQAAITDQLAEVHRVAERLCAAPLLDAVRDLAQRARLDLPGVAQAPRRDVLDPLTDRERAVLERVALGRTNRQVGAELYISEKTVSVHLSRVMAKLGAARRAEAVAIAYDRGLLSKPADATSPT